MNHPYFIDIDYTRDEQGAVLFHEEGDREVPHQLLLEECGDTLEPAMMRLEAYRDKFLDKNMTRPKTAQDAQYTQRYTKVDPRFLTLCMLWYPPSSMNSFMASLSYNEAYFPWNI
jgi:hypothetical protein